jgi:holin (3TMs family)
MADILGEVGQLVGNAVGGTVTGGLGPAVGGFFELLNKFVPDKGQQAAMIAAKEKEQADYAQRQLEIQAAEHQKQLDMQQAAHTEDMELLKAQIDVNKVQAGNSNLFVAGPRPFAQWATTIIILIGLESVFVATCMHYWASTLASTPLNGCKGWRRTNQPTAGRLRCHPARPWSKNEVVGYIFF